MRATDTPSPTPDPEVIGPAIGIPAGPSPAATPPGAPTSPGAGALRARPPLSS